MTTIAYDCVLDRPGCVMVAAGLGADSQIPNRFSPHSWLVHVSPDMKVYEVTDEQLDILVARSRAKYGV
jgi:hypothetical protein